MHIAIDQKRLASITHLYSGSHDASSDQMCVMEAVAYVTHKDWTDHPPCVCPVLGAFMRSWNDGLPDDKRTALMMPFIPRLINTRGSKQLEQRRSTMAADWLIRTPTVAWLRLAKLDKQADMLSSVPEITDLAQCPSLMPTLTAVQNDAAAAWVASGVAARAAAWDAAVYAAVYAAVNAGWDDPDTAAYAAWFAARDAAMTAARNAAMTAARNAARDAAVTAAVTVAVTAARDAAMTAARDAAVTVLNDTCKKLQISAVYLVNRMIDLRDDEQGAA